MDLKIISSLMGTGFFTQFQSISTKIINYKDENGNYSEEIWWLPP